MKKQMRRPAELLYAVLDRNGKLTSRQVRIDMEHLYPGQDQDKLRREFYIKKIEKTMLILLGGTVLAVFMAARSIRGQPLERENMLKRGDVLKEGQDVWLEGSYGDQKERFHVYVEPLQIKADDLAEWYEKFSDALPELIAGQNSSLQDVRSNLNLAEQYEGFPFHVEWRSYDTESITSSGEVKPDGQDKEVMLKAEISYGEQEWETVLWITVPAKEYSREEYRYQKTATMLEEAERNSREEEYWELPATVDEQKITWRNPTEKSWLVLLAASWGVGVLIFFLSDRDLHQELEKQRECMKQEYPDIVHKLALYLGAGMTLQGAFQKIGSEYELQKKQGRELSPGYEQILYTCRELKSGVSESSAYERFGRRTGLQEYIRLSTLMTQNLKKGSSSLLERLHEETEKALIQRIQSGRKLGEEAATKLLVPMVMMLGVVMVMVMLPAFISMGM